jgi:hypothetical protein
MKDELDPVTRTARRGRPTATTPHAQVSTWLPACDAERLVRLARAQRVSVSAVVRRIVILRLRGE